jgi:hypothetical protein
MKKAGMSLIGTVLLAAGMAVPNASAQELSDKSVKSFMDYAWALTPAQFTKPDGEKVIIDKKKREDSMVPMDVAREVIKVGRMTAYAQVCELTDDEIMNYRSLMLRESQKNKWSKQQMIYINQLHLATVMLMTGKLKLVEKDATEGGKEVAVDEKKPIAQTCTPEQRDKVKETIQAYVKTGPSFASAEPAPAAKAAAAPAAAPKK